MWIKVVFGCWCLGLCGALNSSEVDVIGHRGQSVVLPCTPTLTQSTVRWKKLPRDGDRDATEKTLYNGHEVFDPFKYNIGRYDLTVRGLDFEDAGTYKCVLLKNGNSPGIKNEGNFSAELTVVDSDLVCNANFSSTTELREGDLIGVTCNVSYLGKAVPVTRCHTTQSSEQRSTGLPSNATDGTAVIITVTIQVNIDLNGQTLNCQTYFQPTSNPTQESNGSSNGSSNIPGYSHSWPSPRLNVLYAPRNLRLDPASESYDLGTVVRCVADANPIPTLVEWHNTGNGQEFTDAQLTIEAPVFSPGTFKYRCTVANTVDRSNSTFTIRVKGEKSAVTLWTVAAIGMPVFVVILTLLAATGVLVVKNRAIRRKLNKQEVARTFAAIHSTENERLSDYDEILGDSPIAQSTSANPNTSADIATDVYDNESKVIRFKASDLSYTGLTGPRETPGPSFYTALENSGQPPLPPPTPSPPSTPPYDDISTTSSNTSDGGTRDVSSAQRTSAKTPNYVNEPVNLGDNAEEALGAITCV